MALTNTRERYGKIARMFHWLTALLILGLLIVGTIMPYLPEGNADEIARKVFVYSMHKTMGVAVLLVAILRIIWAFINPRPEPLHPERKMETFAAETVHWMLYIAILAMPVTGLLYHASTTGFAPIWWPFGQTLPFVPKDENLGRIFSAMHWLLALGVTLTLIAHVGGALKHLVFDKDETVARMMPGGASEDFTVFNSANNHRSGQLSAVSAVLAVGLSIGAMGYYVNQSSIASATRSSVAPADSGEAHSGDFPWTVVSGQSSLKINVQQMGSSVEGEFGNWDATINFDPGNLNVSYVDARIDVSSLQLGSVSDQAKSGDFLDVETHPQARFISDAFRQRPDGRYEAEGTLEIAGVEQPFVLEFSLKIAGDRADMQASATVNRMEFDIGAEKYADESSVAHQVTINIDLVADKKW